jgi:hypothetical protein
MASSSVLVRVRARYIPAMLGEGDYLLAAKVIFKFK